MADKSVTKRYLRMKHIISLFPFGRTTVIEGIKSGRFKLTPIKNGRCVFFDAQEVELALQKLAE